ncbi:hydrogenase maturation protease [Anabaena sp. 4-3]|uniref:hydrogenase maturation protease n=1 Tax=Anabaena sp. 4-3 TaxID=1811979 RepID=UPI0008329B04|nr:hydrogenase maturation protease [Anabaena sp. 4-3]
MKKTVMVIGYGNDLRSDDGVGQSIANEIASWHLSSVQSLAVHQLTPDLAAALANTDLAIFVDACLPVDGYDVQIQALLPDCDVDGSVHTSNPRSLLALTQALYGNCPTAWLVTIPGINFEVGDRLSRIAEMGKAVALVKIIQILDKVRNCWVDIRASA